MAYQGYLIKIGNDVFPHKYIIAESYKVKPNQRLDLDSTRNANGVLQRKVLTHMPSTVEFQIGQGFPTFTDDVLEECMGIIRSNFANASERKVPITFYCPDTNDYKTETAYMPDPEYTIARMDGDHVYYSSFTFKFIGY